MIRVFIIVIGLFLIWVLFLSSFTKRRKLTITSIALVMCAIGVWLESNTGLPKRGVVANKDVISCGIQAQPSYRSNFDLTICLRNSASDGLVKQLSMAITPKSCSAPDNCLDIETVLRDVNVDIAPNTDVTIEQNLSFDAVDPAASNTVWTVQIVSVKAIR